MRFLRVFTLLSLLLAVVLTISFLSANAEKAAPFFNAILMMGIPLALGFFLSNKFKVDLGLFGIGALTFIISQVFHIPFNSWVLNPLVERLGLQANPGSLNLALLGLLFGLSAGLFEETARYIVYKKWLQDKLSWKEGLLFGAGHGGIEAFIFGALAFWGFIQLVTFQDISPDALAALVGPDKVDLVQSFLTTYWSAPWYYNLLGIVERVGAMAIHLCASVLVLQAFTRKNIGWYFLAVFWHTSANAVAVYSSQTWNVYITEGIVLLFGLASLGIVFSLRKSERYPKDEPITASQPSAPTLPLPGKPEEIDKEKLEDSRYE